MNPFVGAQARPNEVTYSEDWMRPDYVPPAAAGHAAAPASGAPRPTRWRRRCQPRRRAPTEPGRGLPGMMVPPGARVMMRGIASAHAVRSRWSRWRWSALSAADGKG